MAAFVDRALKRRYIDPTDGLQSVVERVSPTLEKITKVQRAGDSINELVRPAGPIGLSYDLAAAQTVTAQTDHGASDYETFICPFGEYHGSVKVSLRALQGSKGREAAFIEQLFVEMDSMLESWGAVAARKILGPIGGAIGRIEDIDQGGGNGEIALYVQGDAFNFSNVMILQAAAGTGSGSTTPRSGLGYVAQVVPDADVSGTSTTGWHLKVGTSTANAIAGTAGLPTGWLDNDYLFRYGDVLSGTDLSDKQIRSLQGFITLTNDTSSYLNAVRTQRGMNGFRLSSNAVSGLSIKDRIQKLVLTGRKQYNANKVNTIVVAPDAWQELSNDIQTSGWQGFDSSMKTGASNLVVQSQNGPLEILSDPFCIVTDIWAAAIERVKIYHYNGFPGPVDDDGLKMLRYANSPDFEIRWASFNSLTVGNEPWQFGRCDSGIAAV